MLVVLESRRTSQGGGVRTPCTLPLDPPLNLNNHPLISNHGPDAKPQRYKPIPITNPTLGLGMHSLFGIRCSAFQQNATVASKIYKK